MTEKGERCLQHYLLTYRKSQSNSSNGQALDECLHHFLDQRPASKSLSAFDRSVGLASAPFWWDVQAVYDSDLASRSLIRALYLAGAVLDDAVLAVMLQISSFGQ